MHRLMKGLLAVAPLLALVFWYVTAQQAKHDQIMEHDKAEFRRDWNEFEADSAKKKADRQKYTARAAEAEKEMKAAETAAAPKKARVDNFNKEFDRAVNEADQKGLK